MGNRYNQMEGVTMAMDTSCEFPDLRGRTALVTGAARGLGRAIAEALVRGGAEVCAFDAANPDPGFEGVNFHTIDIREAGAVSDAIAQLREPPLLLVNNAGITRDRTIVKMSNEEWRDVIDVNLTGAFNMIRVCAPAMVAAGHGRIVNITSINGLRGKFGQTNYSASKAGLIGLTKATARELGRKGVTVNAIAPGMVLTDMALALPEALLDDARAESSLGRLAEPIDIANAVLFLLSDAARMITGQVLQVDAGQYL